MRLLDAVRCGFQSSPVVLSCFMLASFITRLIFLFLGMGGQCVDIEHKKRRRGEKGREHCHCAGRIGRLIHLIAGGYKTRERDKRGTRETRREKGRKEKEGGAKIQRKKMERKDEEDEGKRHDRSCEEWQFALIPK